MVNLVLNHSRLSYLDLQRDLEEYSTVPSAIFCALLYVIDEGLSWEEYIAKLALHSYCMLEHSLIDLD